MASHWLSSLRARTSRTNSRGNFPSISKLVPGPARTRKLSVVRYAANSTGVAVGVGDGPRVETRVAISTGVGTRVGRGAAAAARAIFSSAEGGGDDLNCPANSRVRSRY